MNFRYSSANLVRSHKESSLYIVVSVPTPKEGGMIATLTTRFTVGVPAHFGDLIEGDVCHCDVNGNMTKCGHL